MRTVVMPGSRSVVAERLVVVADAVGVERDTAAVAAAVDVHGHSVAWLTLAVLRAELPTDTDVVAFVRSVGRSGAAAVDAEMAAASRSTGRRRDSPRVEVVTDRVVVDLDHTSRTDLATGIQRVARETAARWDRDHDIVVVGWTDGFAALRSLSARERARALGAPAPPAGRRDRGRPLVLVPWRCTLLVPELAAEPVRTARLLGLTRHSGNRVGLIGFDCVPITTAETAADGMGGAFAHMLAAARHAEVIAAISEAAAEEHRGWCDMLHSAGIDGPAIETVVLPVDRRTPTPEQIETARLRFTIGRLPLVLCVGSHEPRKNHLAVLHAAEVLWRRGREFHLLFVGGNSWKGDAFVSRLAELQGAGRTVESVSGLDDDLLWALYALARVTVFPSLNEGYGLPEAESLASGTPVITSGYGSMAEIAAGGGALTVDPRDDDDLAAALDRALTDKELHRRLVSEARARPIRTWDDYAADTWNVLVGSDGAAEAAS